MKMSNYALCKQLGANNQVFYREKGLQETISAAKDAFIESEAEGFLSRAEFLYQQCGYIHKRWWILQGITLFSLWLILQITESSYYIQQCMGIAASLFSIMLLPELWKNRTSNSLEIECISYYSLRQVYSARIFAFAMVDLLLLCSFALPTLLLGRLLIEEMIIYFFLPYLVTCCICFRVLSDQRIGSEIFALFLCGFWCVIWTRIVLSEKIYGAISTPVWFTMTAIALLYLIYCIYKEQNNCTKYSQR